MQKPHNYYFFSFYRYLNPGFLPLHIAPTRFLFCCVDPDSPAPYQEKASAVFDSSYCAWMAGQTTHGQLPQSPITEPIQNIADNYLFVRRHFAGWWLWYIFFRRLFACNIQLNEPVILLRTLRQYKRIVPSKTASKKHESSSSKSTARVSVIIPTRNRYPQLKNLLAQLATQTIQPHEIIVADQSDLPDPNLALPDNAIKFHHLTNIAGAQASARNAAIGLCSGDYIASLDDDCEVLPDFIENHLQTLAKGADVSTGPYFENTSASLKNLQQNKFTIAAHMPAGNFMSTKAFFDSCGLFDTRYDNLPVEDAELFARATALGKRIVCNHQAVALHLHLNSGGLRHRKIFPGLANATAFLHKEVLAFYVAHTGTAFAREIINSRMLQGISQSLKQTGSFVLFRPLKAVILLLVWPFVYLAGIYHVSRITAKE